jgi:hypothetical protein
MNMTQKKIDTPVVVNTDDLTLAELDRATKLTQDGSAGNVTALAFVWLKRSTPGVRLADVEQLRQRDVRVVDDAELAAEGGSSGVATDPTT